MSVAYYKCSWSYVNLPILFQLFNYIHELNKTYIILVVIFHQYVCISDIQQLNILNLNIFNNILIGISAVVFDATSVYYWSKNVIFLIKFLIINRVITSNSRQSIHEMIGIIFCVADISQSHCLNSKKDLRSLSVQRVYIANITVFRLGDSIDERPREKSRIRVLKHSTNCPPILFEHVRRTVNVCHAKCILTRHGRRKIFLFLDRSYTYAVVCFNGS